MKPTEENSIGDKKKRSGSILFLKQLMGTLMLLYGVIGFLFYFAVFVMRELFSKYSDNLPFNIFPGNALTITLILYLLLYFIITLSGIFIFKNLGKRSFWFFMPATVVLLFLNDNLNGSINYYSWLGIALFSGLLLMFYKKR